MKKLIAVIVFALLITGCSAEPEIIDNGKPGRMKIILFLDQNRNSVKDQDEPGLVDRVGLSQDVSCPAGSMDKVTAVETNAAGEAIFEDLQPGVYCVAYLGGRGSTTKLTVEVHLSSEQETLVGFGITDE